MGSPNPTLHAAHTIQADDAQDHADPVATVTGLSVTERYPGPAAYSFHDGDGDGLVSIRRMRLRSTSLSEGVVLRRLGVVLERGVRTHHCANQRDKGGTVFGDEC